MLGNEIAEGDAVLGAVSLHLLRHRLQRLVELLVRASQRELLSSSRRGRVPSRRIAGRNER